MTLFGLVPGTNVGYPAIALGIIGLLFTSRRPTIHPG